MDPNRRDDRADADVNRLQHQPQSQQPPQQQQPGPQRTLAAAPSATSLGYLAPGTPSDYVSRARSHSGGSANAGPFAQSRTPQAITPASEGQGGEYFPSLGPSHSMRSRVSAQDSLRPPSSSGNPPSVTAADRGQRSRQPSIRIRRRSSASSTQQQQPATGAFDSFPDFSSVAAGSSYDVPAGSSSVGRQRSVSQPERSHAPPDAANVARRARRVPQVAMPRLTEEGARPTMEELGVVDDEPISPSRSLPEADLPTQRPWLAKSRKISRFFWPGQGRRQEGELPQYQNSSEQPPRPFNQVPLPRNPVDQEYDERLVDWLDTIDPEVQTLSTLTNVQNSLFIPSLGSLINRRPTYTLSQHDAERLPRIPAPAPPPSEHLGNIPEQRVAETDEMVREDGAPPLMRSSTITSRLTESHYAALPHGQTLEGWSAEEKQELDDHVRHMLHSRRSKLKRSFKGFGQYVRRPLGFFVTLYATLITLFGLAWVLFLIGWIYVGEKQLYIIHIIDSVLVALFAIMGDGLAPFRAVDTYHMAFVVHYARIVKNVDKRPRSRLQKHNIPESVRDSIDFAALESRRSRQSARSARALNDSPEQTEMQAAGIDVNDAASAASEPSNDPHTMRNNIVDVEDAKSGIDAYEDTPLTYKQQLKLHHHQQKLAKSHSFYKPHETETHYAFPLGYLIAIVVLLDCHSCLQISLGACTWGIDYHVRPFALTTVILCVSITCNIAAGLVITIGDRKTRKKDVWNLMSRQELTGDAIKKIEEKRSKDPSTQNLMSTATSASNNDKGKDREMDTDEKEELRARGTGPVLDLDAVDKDLNLLPKTSDEEGKAPKKLMKRGTGELENGSPRRLTKSPT